MGRRRAGAPTGRAAVAARLLKPCVFLVSLVPLGLLAWAGAEGELGANPVETITRATGDWTLRFLLITLAMTPLRRITGWRFPARVRRMLGLYAFFYGSLHLATYLVLDASLDLAYIFEDVADRLYITAGFTSFCLLVPLAATSTDAMVRRLGGRRWQQLHRLAYVAALGGVLHFLWLVKADLREPLVYLAILVALLAMRLPPVARRLPALRGAPPRAAAASR